MFLPSEPFANRHRFELHFLFGFGLLQVGSIRLSSLTEKFSESVANAFYIKKTASSLLQPGCFYAQNVELYRELQTIVQIKLAQN